MVYFMADSHVGSLLMGDREGQVRRVCEWLRGVCADAEAIYLLGDVWDFWFEFAGGVPEGFDELLDTIRGVTDGGVPVHFFVGNHDQWTFGYLERRCGMVIHRGVERVVIGGRRFVLGHGHGLGERRWGTRLLNGVFENGVLRWVFRHAVVPRWGVALGYRWSARNRRRHDRVEAEVEDRIDYYEAHTSDVDACQVRWAKVYARENVDTDFIVMGHLHREVNMLLGSGCQLVILGAFYDEGGYAVFDGERITMCNI